MADRKISELPIASTTTASDVVPIVQSGITKQISVGNLLSGGSILNVKDPQFGAKGDNSTNDTAAIQAAITACPIYGTVYIPDGDYVVGALTFSKPLTLRGDGFGSQLIVDPALAVGTDVLTITTTGSSGSYFVFRDFAVTPRSVVGGRHAIKIDATTIAVKDSLFENLHLYQLNGQALVVTGTGAGQGSLVATTVRGCTLGGGATIDTCGDAVSFTRNHVTGVGTKGLDVSFQVGASTFVYSENVFTADGGLRIRESGTAVQIINNEFETNSTFTGSNGALIDIAGASGSACNDTLVAFNSFQVVNGITTNTIRCDYANRTHIVGNRMDHGITTSNDVAITANANDTIIGHNTWPDTTPVLSDSGTRTLFFSPVNGQWLFKQFVTVASTAGAVDGERVRLGRTDDGNRYSSIYTLGASGGTATVTVKVHDGVSATSQADAVVFKADSNGGWTQAPSVVLNAAARARTAGYVSLGNATQGTVGAAGAATALPANPTGYLRFFIGATEYVLPYYAQA